MKQLFSRDDSNFRKLTTTTTTTNIKQLLDEVEHDIRNSYSSRTCRIWVDNNQLGLRPRWLYIYQLISNPYMGKKRKPMSWFSHVHHGYRVARGRVCTTAGATTTTVESRKMAAILQITGWQRDMQPWFTAYFFGIGHPCYDQLTSVKTRYPLTSITWPYRGLNLTAHRGQVCFWRWALTMC